MAMTSLFWTTNGIGDGSAPYTQAQLTEWLRKMFLTDHTVQGVVRGVGDEFAVTGTSSPLTVGSGFAFVYGFPAWDNAAQEVTIPTPVIGTTGHRLVLRADWATQTVRVALLSSNDGVAAIPELTQDAGSRWEISLATLTVTTGGTISVTDTRQYAHTNIMLDGSRLDDASITADKLSPGVAVANLGFTPLNKAGDTATGKLLVRRETTLDNNLFQNGHFEARTDSGGPAAIGFHRANNDAMALYYQGGNDLRVRRNSGTDGKLWSELNDGDGSGLDADKVAGVDYAPFVRVGGQETNWGAGGSTVFYPTEVRVVAGATNFSLASGSALATAVITLPFSFNGRALGVGVPSSQPTEGIATATVTGSANNQISVTLRRHGSTDGTFTTSVQWIAFGPA